MLELCEAGAGVQITASAGAFESAITAILFFQNRPKARLSKGSQGATHLSVCWPMMFKFTQRQACIRKKVRCRAGRIYGLSDKVDRARACDLGKQISARLAVNYMPSN